MKFWGGCYPGSSRKLKLNLSRSPPDGSDDNLDVMTEPGDQLQLLRLTDPTELALRDARDFGLINPK